MKKLISIFLALALIMSLSTTAFATTLTIADDDVVTRTYNGYKLLHLTVSLKPDCGCAEGVTHTDHCYNYAYSVNEDYSTILQTLAGENKDIIEYLSELKSDNEGGTLRGVADDIYRAIQRASIEADAPNLTTTTNIDQGYWLFADVTNLNAEEEANSLVIVDTKGLETLTITPKTALPTVEKKVKDINDSSDADIDDNAWQDSADHDIGNDVPFKLTATLPGNVAYYNSYKVAFHDTLSSGLTLKPETIKVLMYATKDAAEADVDTKNIADGDGATDVTAYFPHNISGNEFTVSCANVKNIEGVTKDTVFVVYYEATLNATADIGLPGNPNEVYLEFSNNPYTDGTGNTEKDEVIVYTYQLTINKTDDNDNPLAGAGFTLYKKDAAGTYVPIGDALTGTGESGNIFEWTGLDDGAYKLVETTVPAGYNKMNDVEFTITAEHEAASKTLSAGNFANGVFDTGIIEQDIENNTGTVLPETGAKGTMMLISISTMFVMAAVVFMVTRKKMSIYED